MLSDRFKYDSLECINLNNIQKLTKNQVLEKLNKGIYLNKEVKCQCGNNSFEILSEKDRYGIPLTTVICQKCGLVMTNPRMNQFSYDQFYDKEYRKLYLGVQEPNFDFYNLEQKRGEKIFRYVSSSINLDNNEVLEVGCGAGGILDIFKKNGCSVIGVDLDSNYINYGIDKGLELYCTHSKNLIDKYLEKFDLIILSHVLEHFLDIDSELEIIYKLLKPTGYLYVEVPGLKSLLIGYDKCDFLYYLQNAHTYSFDLDTLVQIMKWSKFKFIKGDERIHSLFKKIDYRSNTVVNYYNDVKSYLVDLEKNKDKYKKEYENFMEKKSRAEREKKFKIVKERISNYKDNTVVLYGTGNHTKILLDYMG
ncbi:class I SAM-dependent methyltransferase, partial [Clostridium sp.]|uniref:class I SAM-dependent methyltransferase n=1 Tax=Clostridium sp. TaxID=1506 RepID=UPI0025BE9587